jgi:hypothetical protein
MYGELPQIGPTSLCVGIVMFAVGSFGEKNEEDRTYDIVYHLEFNIAKGSSKSWSCPCLLDIPSRNRMDPYGPGGCPCRGDFTLVPDPSGHSIA